MLVQMVYSEKTGFIFFKCYTVINSFLRADVLNVQLQVLNLQDITEEKLRFVCLCPKIIEYCQQIMCNC